MARATCGAAMKTTDLDRFSAKYSVDPITGCWLWQASMQPAGYGGFWDKKKRAMVSAHRFAYELLVGSVPDGFDVDHLCRVRRCVNPAHLEPVTRAENIRRGLLGSGTHCRKGHPFVDVYLSPTGARICRVCRRKNDAARRAKDPHRATRWRQADRLARRRTVPRSAA